VSERPTVGELLPLADALVDALRPVVAKLVAAELDERQREREAQDDDPPYWTVAQYAERVQTTPAAVRARIRRRALDAFKPPGGREWLIPNDDRQGVAGATMPSAKSAPATLTRPGA
jgi:hypothetical protein